MKLRNKKTGKIVDVESLGHAESLKEKYGYQVTLSWKTEYENLSQCKDYDSLAELNEEWEDVPDEEWRDVLGFEELYQVSNLGNVRTIKRGEATVMSQEEHRNGYLSVHLRYKGVERRASVHRLVAEAFIPNPDGLRDVNHKNGVKTDNRVENLEWLSHSDNIKHAYQMKKPTEPLIKDEKIRKAVRAWAEVNDFEPDCKVRYGANSYSLFSSEASIEFNIRIKGLEHLKDYTIKELCGEEEECEN